MSRTQGLAHSVHVRLVYTKRVVHARIFHLMKSFHRLVK